MKIKLTLLMTLLLTTVLLAGCATTELKAPCPNFGEHCRKMPINSWDYQNT